MSVPTFPTVPFSRAGTPLAVGQFVTITGTVTSLNGATDQTTNITVSLTSTSNTVSVKPLDIASNTETL
jgi:hypothetical protein